jgi:hypothetical protein
LGLETKYEQFYSWLLKGTSEYSKIANIFKEVVVKKPEDWSDLEIGSGEHTSKIDNEEESNELHDYLIDRLSKYLSDDNLNETKLETIKGQQILRRTRSKEQAIQLFDYHQVE